MNLGKTFLFIGNKIFPFIALPILIWLWMRSGGIYFMLFVLGLPLLFGYIAPAIGTNVQRCGASMTVGRSEIFSSITALSMPPQWEP